MVREASRFLTEFQTAPSPARPLDELERLLRALDPDFEPEPATRQRRRRSADWRRCLVRRPRAGAAGTDTAGAAAGRDRPFDRAPVAGVAGASGSRVRALTDAEKPGSSVRRPARRAGSPDGTAAEPVGTGPTRGAYSVAAVTAHPLHVRPDPTPDMHMDTEEPDGGRWMTVAEIAPSRSRSSAALDGARERPDARRCPGAPGARQSLGSKVARL